MDSALVNVNSPKKRKNVTFACKNCRKRRTKCDGEKPCGGCAHSELPCVYDSGADGRTKRSRQQNIAGLENDSNCLRLILENARKGDEMQISNLVDRLKITESVADLEGWLKDQFSDSESPQIKPSPRNASSSHPTGTPLTGLSSPTTYKEESPEPVRIPGASSEAQSTVDSADYQFNNTLMHERLRNYIIKAIIDSHDWHPALCASLDDEDLAKLLQEPGISSDSDPQPSGQRIALASEQPQDVTYSGAVGRISRGLGWTSDIKTNGFASAVQRQQLLILEQPEWSILPLSFDDQSPLCRAFISFWHAAVSMISKGTPIKEILGSGKPCIDWFLQPRRSDSETHDVSYWASSIMFSFVEFDAASRLRSILLCYQLMRWMIAPSPETYESLAACQRPTVGQRLIPHSATIDFFVHEPELRTGLCQNPRDFLTTAVENSINWPKKVDEAVEADRHGSLYMTREFENHALNTGNWTYSSKFVAIFPELKDLVRIKDG